MWAFVAGLPASVLRAKGFVHLTEDPERRYLLQFVGRRWALTPSEPRAMPSHRRVWCSSAYPRISPGRTTYLRNTRPLGVHVSWLRHIVEQDPSHLEHILAERAAGDVFALEEQSQTRPLSTPPVVPHSGSNEHDDRFFVKGSLRQSLRYPDPPA